MENRNFLPKGREIINSPKTKIICYLLNVLSIVKGNSWECCLCELVEIL